jgi:glycosyltransferase involved in cell wall biosynthesis
VSTNPPIFKHLFLNIPAPSTSMKVCVIVPVRNEADGLENTLDALRLQKDANGEVLSFSLYEVLILFNNCTDDSYQIGLDYAQKHTDFNLRIEKITLPKTLANIGTVRRLLMDEAYRRLMLINNKTGIIASTDGDTVVDAKWISSIVSEISKGIDAVGGRILTENVKCKSRIYHLKDVAYRCLLSQIESMIDPRPYDPFPHHFQYFGANMAVTCKMYHQAGRLPNVPFLEDLAFHKALQHQDAKIRRSFDVKVYTSTRTDGRVEVGFSEQLNKWKNEDASNIPQMVEAVEPMIMMFMIRKRLRSCWLNYRENQILSQQDLQVISTRLRVSTVWLELQIKQTPYFGVLWANVEQQRASLVNHKKPLQSINMAIKQLRFLVKHYKPIVSQTSPNDTYQSVDLIDSLAVYQDL